MADSSFGLNAKFASQIEQFGIKSSRIHRNLSVIELVEIAVEKNEGIVTSTGSLSVKTGKYTGRSPDDRFIVYDDQTHDSVNWGDINHQFPVGKFDKIFEKMKKFVEARDLFVFDGFVGAEKENRLAIRVINDHAWQNLFVRQLFIRPSTAELESHEPEFTVMCINDFDAIPEVDGVRLGHSVGTKKRKEIIIKAIEKKFKVFNARVSARGSKS